MFCHSAVTVWIFIAEIKLFQEKTVALKIFELGLKKYGGIPEYLLCYMDFMSHLNGNVSSVIMMNYVIHLPLLMEFC
jgi:cleavage stimulation factor subunit 3